MQLFPIDPDIVYLYQSESMFCGFSPRAHPVVTLLVSE